MLDAALTAKLNLLRQNLADYNSVLIAFSGGVDSSLLLKIASLVQKRVLAVTAVSPTYLDEEKEEAIKLASDLGVKHQIIHTHEFDNANFTANPPERCYYCKKELYQSLGELAREHNLEAIIDGSNADDNDDFRPGMRAARECGIKSPLQEVNLTKSEIRQLAKYLNLPNWDKPSMACLSSRIPYGQTITKEKLSQVALAEAYLRALGFKEVRVRHHDTIARIEVSPQYFILLIDESVRQGVIEYFHKLGFTYITVDLAGFRSGSMNEVLGQHLLNSK